MDETEASKIFDGHLGNALAWANERRAHYDCGLKGPCHALLIVDPSASLYAPLCALTRVDLDRLDGKPFIGIVPTPVAAWLVDAQFGSESVYDTADAMPPNDLIVIGVVGDHVIEQTMEIAPHGAN